MCFPGVSVVKNPPTNAVDVSLISGSEVSSEVGNGNPFQYSCLKNSMDRGAWWAAVHGIAESWTRWKQLSTHNHVYESSAYTHTHTHIRFIPLAIALNRFSMLLSGCSHHRRNWLRTFKHLYFSILMFSTRLMVI